MKYVVLTAHNSSALYDHPDVTVVDSLDRAADVVEKHLRSYDFTIEGTGRSKRIYDRHAGDKPAVFIDVKWHKGRPIEYVHCDGDGPIAKTHRAKEST